MTLTDNLQGRWKMEEASGNLVDECGNNNLMATGAPTYQQTGGAPEGSYSILYDGVDDTHASGTSPTGLVITGNFSMQAWVNFVSMDSAYQDVICGRWDASPVDYSYCFQRGDMKGLPGVAFCLSSNGSTFSASASPQILLSISTWYQIVGVYNGTDMRVYVNGVLYSGNLNPLTYSSGIWGGSSKFRIAGASLGGSKYEPMNVKLDDVCVWNRALSATEVLQSYQSGFAGNKPPSAPSSIVMEST